MGPAGLRTEVAEAAIWKAVGGPRSEIATLIDLLVRATLVSTQQGHYRLTKSGRQVATQDHRYGGTLMVKALIEAGIFHVQARRLLEASDLDGSTGSLVCPRVRVQSLAPQLAGLLRRYPDVRFQADLHVPRPLVELLDDSWISAQSIPAQDRRKQLGDRSEEFSYRLERARAADRTLVRWVAQDDDSLGYDIEDLNSIPPRRIEVKSTSGSEIRFFLSDHEWAVAHDASANYEIQFWGGVRVDAQPLAEYRRLTSAGFPIMYRNPVKLVAEGRLTLTPSVYVVREPPPTDAAEDGAPAAPAS